MSPAADYLKTSGLKKYQNFMGSRNPSPSEMIYPKVSVNQSYGMIKFNISMDNDKLKSIRRKAKNKGLFAFDPASSIRLKRVSAVKNSISRFSTSKSGVRYKSPTNASIVSQQNSPHLLVPQQRENAVRTKAQSFISLQPKMHTIYQKSPKNLNSASLDLHPTSYRSITNTKKSCPKPFKKFKKQIKTTQNSPSGT